MRRLRLKTKDESGAISVEFVLLSSFYLGVIFTLFAIIDAYVAATRGYKANAIVSNVISRHLKVDDTAFGQSVAVYQAMTSSDDGSSTMRMTLLKTVLGTPEIQWSVNSEGDDYCIPSDYALIAQRFPDLPESGEVVLLETSFQFTPIFDSAFVGEMTMAQSSIFIPRFASSLLVDDDTNPAPYVCNYVDGEFNPSGGDDDAAT